MDSITVRSSLNSNFNANIHVGIDFDLTPLRLDKCTSLRNISFKLEWSFFGSFIAAIKVLVHIHPNNIETIKFDMVMTSPKPAIDLFKELDWASLDSTFGRFAKLKEVTFPVYPIRGNQGGVELLKDSIKNEWKIIVEEGLPISSGKGLLRFTGHAGELLPRPRSIQSPKRRFSHVTGCFL